MFGIVWFFFLCFVFVCFGFFVREFGFWESFFFFLITVNSMPCPVRVVSVGYHYMDTGSISQNDRSISDEFRRVDRGFLHVLVCGAVEGGTVQKT